MSKCAQVYATFAATGAALRIPASSRKSVKQFVLRINLQMATFFICWSRPSCTFKILATAAPTHYHNSIAYSFAFDSEVKLFEVLDLPVRRLLFCMHLGKSYNFED